MKIILNGVLAAMVILWTVLVLLCMGFITSHFAQKRGREEIAWFVIGASLGFIGLIILFLLPSRIKEANAQPAPVASPAWTLPVHNSELTESVTSTTSQIESDVTSAALAAYKGHDWHYIDVKGKQEGPCHYEDLKLAVRRDDVKQDSYVWTEGMAEWKRAHELPELAADLWPSS